LELSHFGDKLFCLCALCDVGNAWLGSLYQTIKLIVFIWLRLYEFVMILWILYDWECRVHIGFGDE